MLSENIELSIAAGEDAMLEVQQQALLMQEDHVDHDSTDYARKKKETDENTERDDNASGRMKLVEDPRLWLSLAALFFLAAVGIIVFAGLASPEKFVATIIKNHQKHRTHDSRSTYAKQQNFELAAATTSMGFDPDVLRMSSIPNRSNSSNHPSNSSSHRNSVSVSARARAVSHPSSPLCNDVFADLVEPPIEHLKATQKSRSTADMRPDHTSVPPGCPSDKFVIPMGEGGLTNGLLRIWHSIISTNRTRSHTIVLPHIRNHPGRFKPAQHLGKSQFIPLSELFETESLCRMLERLNVCFVCRYFPPGTEPEEKNDDDDDAMLLKYPANDFKAPVTRHIGGVQIERKPEFYFFLKHLQPNAQVRAALESIKSQNLKSEEYLAVHMRIEDDWKAFKRGQFYLNASEIVKQVVNADFSKPLTRDGKLNVYIATGAKQEAIQYWSSIENVNIMHSPVERMRELPWAVNSLIDFEIAKDATAFVGTAMFSTFSTNLFFYRNMRKKCSSATSAADSSAFADVDSFAYHNSNTWGFGDLLECRSMCWGAEKNTCTLDNPESCRGAGGSKLGAIIARAKIK